MDFFLEDQLSNNQDFFLRTNRPFLDFVRIFFRGLKNKNYMRLKKNQGPANQNSDIFEVSFQGPTEQ